MAKVSLVQAPPDALRRSRMACANGLVAVKVARYVDTDGLDEPADLLDRPVEVFEDIADRVRTAARHGAEGFLFTGGVTGADPFSPEPYVQSATFLAMAAALECSVPVRFLSEGLPAKGFAALFRRYRSQVAGQVRFVGPIGSGLSAIEPNAASVEARLRGLAPIADALRGEGVAAARIDPVIPGLNDDSDLIAALASGLERARITTAVVAPLRFNAYSRGRIAELFGEQVLARVARHYVPGRARRRVAPVPPGERLPLEREASLLWRLRLAFEAHGIDLVACVCRDGRKAACGLGVARKEAAPPEDQLALWAV